MMEQRVSEDAKPSADTMIPAADGAEPPNLGRPMPGAVAVMIGYALRRAQMAVMDDFNQTIVGGGIRALHFAVLMVIGAEPGCRSSQLSHELVIKHTNLVPLLDELQSRGLVERRTVPEDRRARGLYLTEPGYALLKFLQPRVEAHETLFATRLGVDGKSMLLGLLARLTDAGYDPPRR